MGRAVCLHSSLECTSDKDVRVGVVGRGRPCAVGVVLQMAAEVRSACHGEIAA